MKAKERRKVKREREQTKVVLKKTARSGSDVKPHFFFLHVNTSVVRASFEHKSTATSSAGN